MYFVCVLLFNIYTHIYIYIYIIYIYTYMYMYTSNGRLAVDREFEYIEFVS